MQYKINVSIQQKKLDLIHIPENKIVKSYVINTSKHGPGEQAGSYKTPRGKHIIRAKIGSGEAANTIFKGRRPTGEYYREGMKNKFPGKDWILTRILWLSGTEPGLNRLGDVDTMRRYIYIHGCPDDYEMAKNSSIGCINMRNNDLIELFDLVPVYTSVLIEE